MRYLLLLYGDEDGEASLSAEERRAIVDAHLRFHASLRDRGALVAGEPLADGPFTVRTSGDGRRAVTDGPFAETKEQLGSYYLVECGSRDEALAIAQEVPSSPGLVVEAWPVADL
jgi:hypothetical protein